MVSVISRRRSIKSFAPVYKNEKYQSPIHSKKKQLSNNAALQLCNYKAKQLD